MPPVDFNEVYYNTYYNWYSFIPPDYFPIRKTHIEYFDKTLIRQFETDMDLQLMGHTSVSLVGQKSMKLTSSSSYNEPSMQYNIFRERPAVSEYKGIALRSEYGGKSTWDGISAPLLIKKTYVDVAAYEPCIVFCNGQYWGEYQLRELANSEWVNHNYGISKDSIDFVHQLMDKSTNVNIEAINGSDTGFVNLRNYMLSYPTPNTNAYYNYVSSKLDVENYVDYFTYQTYMANWDWINNQHFNNIKLWRKQGQGANTKWRYFIFDMDYFGGYIAEHNFTSLAYVMSPFAANIHSDIFNRFMMNDKLKHYFINRYADLMNTIFQPSAFLASSLAYRDSSATAMVRHWQRWPNPYGGSSVYATWYNNVSPGGYF